MFLLDRFFKRKSAAVENKLPISNSALTSLSVGSKTRFSKRYFLLLGLVAVISLLLVASGAYIKNINTGSKYETVEENNLSLLAKLQTEKLLEAKKIYLGASLAEKDRALENLRQIAVQRKQILSELIDQNPQEFYNLALSSQEFAKFPEEIKNEIEQEVLAQGELAALHIDNEQTELSSEHLYLKTGKSEKLWLYNLDQNESKPYGNKLQAKGIKLDEKIVTKSLGTNQSKVLSSHNSNIEVFYNTAVVLFGYGDGFSILEEYVRSVIFTGEKSVKSYYLENSFNRFNLVGLHDPINGDIYVYDALPEYEHGCSAEDLVFLQGKLREIASEQVEDLNSYQKIIYVLDNSFYENNPNCAKVAGFVNYPNSQESTILKFNPQTVGHEMGHSFGAHHSDAFSCYSTNERFNADQPDLIIMQDLTTEHCRQRTYKDPYSIMNKDHTRHLNVLQKQRMGIIDGTNIQEVYNDGEYTIKPINGTNSSGKLGLRVARYTALDRNKPYWYLGEYYYIEYRIPNEPFDNFSSTDNVTNGIAIRIGESVNEFEPTYLLNANPDTSFENSSFTLGQTFEDPIFGIKITPISITPQEAKIRVESSNNSIAIASSNSGGAIEAIDGDYTSLENGFWEPLNSQGRIDDWWRLDLRAVRSINKIGIYASAKNPHDWYSKFHIETSLTGAFSGEQSVIVTENNWDLTRNGKQNVIYTFDPIETRYIRVISDIDQNWARLQEFEVYGTSTDRSLLGDVPTGLFSLGKMEIAPQLAAQVSGILADQTKIDNCKLANKANDSLCKLAISCIGDTNGCAKVCDGTSSEKCFEALSYKVTSDVCIVPERDACFVGTYKLDSSGTLSCVKTGGELTGGRQIGGEQGYESLVCGGEGHFSTRTCVYYQPPGKDAYGNEVTPGCFVGRCYSNACKQGSANIDCRYDPDITGDPVQCPVGVEPTPQVAACPDGYNSIDVYVVSTGTRIPLGSKRQLCGPNGQGKFSLRYPFDLTEELNSNEITVGKNIDFCVDFHFSDGYTQRTECTSQSYTYKP